MTSLIRYRAPLAGPETVPATTAPVTAREAAMAPGTARGAARRAEEAPGTTRRGARRAEEDEWDAARRAEGALGTALEDEDEWEEDELEADKPSAEIAAAAFARATATTREWPTTTRELPADWREASDEEGRTYYYHRTERCSQASDCI